MKPASGNVEILDSSRKRSLRSSSSVGCLAAESRRGTAGAVSFCQALELPSSHVCLRSEQSQREHREPPCLEQRFWGCTK